MSTNKIIGVVVVLVLIIGGLMYFNRGDSDYAGEATGVAPKETSASDPREGEKAFVGKLECVPLKTGATPSGDNCVIGLHGDDGKFYAMDNSKVEIIGKGLNPEGKVRIVGKYTATDSASEEAGIFAYDGVIATRVMQAAQ